MTNKDIIASIPRPLFGEVDDLTLNLWVKRAVMLLPNVVKYINKIEYFEVIDGEVILPEDIKQVKSVYWQHSEPNKECTTLIGCETTEPYEVRTQVCKPMVYYGIFLDSVFHKTCFTPLKYVGKDKSLLCNGCPNLHSQCRETFVLRHNVLNTTLDSGWICVEYETLDCENGIIELPDYPIISEYVKAYILKTLWEERSLLNESGATQMLDRYRQEFDILSRKIRGQAFLRNTDYKNLELINKGSYGAFKYGHTN